MEERDTPGAILREKRVAKKLTLKEASERTKINELYLKALEENDLNVLPGEVYIRGFLRNYADLLDLDPERILSLYEQDRSIERSQRSIEAGTGVFTTARRKGRNLFEQTKDWSVSIIEWLGRMGRTRSLYIVLIVSTIFLLTWWFFSFEGKGVLEVAPTLPERTSLVEEPGSLEREGIHLEIEAIEDVWLQYMIDSEDETREVLLRPGEQIGVEAEERITIRVGNAGGLSLRLNGRQLPLLGERGEVATRTFTAKEIGQRE